MPWYIHSISSIYSPHVMSQVEGTKYAFGVAEPYTAGSLKAAWAVLTGRAFAFKWPRPGDLEAAIGMPLYDRAAAPKPTGTQAR